MSLRRHDQRQCYLEHHEYQSYFIIDSVTVGTDVSLTVTPGGIVKFNSGRSLIVNGALRILGTDGNQVYLTSYRDDTVGGDTNGNGATTGARGDWRMIQFTDFSNDATSLIDHAEIRYGGFYDSYGTDYGAITLSSASPTIQNSTIIQSEYAGILATCVNTHIRLQ